MFDLAVKSPEISVRALLGVGVAEAWVLRISRCKEHLTSDTGRAKPQAAVGFGYGDASILQRNSPVDLGARVSGNEDHSGESLCFS